jgi:hypothetical protein
MPFNFTAYTFDMKAGNSTNGYIRMSSSAYSYPLWLGTSLEEAKFKVDWAGNLTCTNINAIGGIDNKTTVVAENEELKEITDQKQETEVSEKEVETKTEKPKKSTSKKSSTKVKNKDWNTLESE